MAVIKLNKIATTQMDGIAGNRYGFAVSVASETEQFEFVADTEIDTDALSADDAEIVNNFIAFVNEFLATS